MRDNQSATQVNTIRPRQVGETPGRRGSREALRRVEELLKEGNYWVADADIKGYFDSIPHHKLMEKVGNKISDGRVLELIESYLKAGVHPALDQF